MLPLGFWLFAGLVMLTVWLLFQVAEWKKERENAPEKPIYEKTYGLGPEHDTGLDGHPPSWKRFKTNLVNDINKLMKGDK